MFINNSIKSTKRKVFIIRFIAALLMFIVGMVLALTLKAQVNKEKPGIFYSITGNGLTDTSYLFGTYHLVKSSYLDEIPAVNESFKKAKGVIVEIVIDSAALPGAMAMGMLKDKTLSAMLDKPFRDSLDKELKTVLGAGLDQLNQLKPANVTLTLSVVYLMINNNRKLNQYSGLPIDGWFTEQGKTASKHITALETIGEQMDLLFNRATDEEQVNQLKLFLRNKTAMTALGDELLQSWFDRDLNQLYSIYDKTLQLSGEPDYLVKDRNDKWMQHLPVLLKKESQFIAAGALHLAGPDGLVQQLRQLGYTVTPIKI